VSVPEKVFRALEHLLRRYWEDFGRMGTKHISLKVKIPKISMFDRTV